MTIAKVADGTLLKIGDAASPEVFTTVPEMKTISGPTISFDLLDATSHDSPGFFREFVPGLADGEQVTGDFCWRPSNAVHLGLRVDSYARTLRNFQLIFPDDTDNTVALAAYVQSIEPKANIGELLMATLTLKITGQPTWS